MVPETPMLYLNNVRPCILRILLKNGYASSVQTDISKSTVEQIIPDQPAQEHTGLPTTIKLLSHVENPKPTVNEKYPEMFIRLEHLEPIPESEAFRKSFPFDDIPGPKYLRHLSKFWNIFPTIGTQLTARTMHYLLSGRLINKNNNARFYCKVLEKYGPVARLHSPFGGDVVLISKPEYVKKVFQDERRYPMRSCLDSLEKYRVEHRKYKQTAPFIMFGAEWEELQKAIQGPRQVCNTEQYVMLEKTCDDFLTRIMYIRNKQDEVPATFRNEIMKWCLECYFRLSFNKHLGFLEPSGVISSSEPFQILHILHNTTYALDRCESGVQFWKFVETPVWKNFVQNCDSLGIILNKHINKAQDSLRIKKLNEEQLNAQNLTLVETFFLKERFLPEDVLTVLFDMILIGVNTISTTVSFLLYYLARNPRIQKTVYDEIQNTAVLDKTDFFKLNYLNACLKETLRLNPPMPIIGRVLSNDIIVHNYRVPKGTYTITATHLFNMREEYFEEAHLFKPDRWLGEDLLESYCLSSITPLDFEENSPIGLGLAKMQISMLLIKLLRKFRVEYHYGEIGKTGSLITEPNNSLRFRINIRD